MKLTFELDLARLSSAVGRLKRFWLIKVLQALCVVYSMVLTFILPAPVGLDQKSGFIDPDPREVVVAANRWQMICLAFSRASAFSLYPPLVLIFFSKCKATLTFLDSTPASIFLNLLDAHDLHAAMGHYIAFDVWIHTIFHCLRWLDQGRLGELLFGHQTGVTGLIAVLTVPLITFPMMYFRDKMSYEVRKGLHYLFFVFGIAVALHVPPNAVPNSGFVAYTLGISMGLFVLDSIFVWMFMTERIDTTHFIVLDNGVQMTMPVSERFRQWADSSGGFVYVCLPWVRKGQWHAFSLYEDPVDNKLRQVLMQKEGDWTSEVHAALQKNSTVRPVWVQGPFPSPYNRAIWFDNLILVASGIGITPAMSVIKAQHEARRTNLIWVVRDPALVEFFLTRFELHADAWNFIFYTGKKQLSPLFDAINPNIRIIKSRPHLPSLIPQLIHALESKQAEPPLPPAPVIQQSLLSETIDNLLYQLREPTERLDSPSYGSQLSDLGEMGMPIMPSKKAPARRPTINGALPVRPEESKSKKTLARRETQHWSSDNLMSLAAVTDESEEITKAPEPPKKEIDSAKLAEVMMSHPLSERKVVGDESDKEENMEHKLNVEVEIPEKEITEENMVEIFMETRGVIEKAKERVEELVKNYCNTAWLLEPVQVTGSTTFLDDIKQMQKIFSRCQEANVAYNVVANMYDWPLSKYGSWKDEPKRLHSKCVVDMHIADADYWKLVDPQQFASLGFRRSSIDSPRPSIDEFRKRIKSQRPVFEGLAVSGHGNGSSFSMLQAKGKHANQILRGIYASIPKQEPVDVQVVIHKAEPDTEPKTEDTKRSNRIPRCFATYEVANEYISKMDRKALKQWGMLYCGGSKPVEDALRDASYKYKIDINTESFAW